MKNNRKSMKANREWGLQMLKDEKARKTASKKSTKTSDQYDHEGDLNDRITGVKNYKKNMGC